MELIAKHRRSSRARRAALIAALSASLFATSAQAQGNAGAAKAFAQAQAAELAGQPEEAARFYELAHMLVPTAEALRSAARTRFEAGQRALAASHADALLRQYAADTKSRTIAQNILDATQGHLISVSIRCRVPCQIEVDGGATPAPASEDRVLYMEPGDHQVTAVFEGMGSTTQQVAGGAGLKLSRSFEPPLRPQQSSQAAQHLERTTGPGAPVVAAEESARRGISRAWFISSAVVAAALAGTAVWSGLDVLKKHDDYKQKPTAAGYDEGIKLERRTNILIGSSAAVGATAVVLAFFTRWSSETEVAPEPPVALRIGVSPLGSSLTFTRRFQ